LNDVVEELTPLFEMDIYLPRSIVACLGTDQLVEVLKKAWVPIEVRLATILYWLKTTWNPLYPYSDTPDKVCCIISKQYSKYENIASM